MSEFGKDWTAPDPIPETTRKKIDELLVSGRLHRYQGGRAFVSEAEAAMARYTGARYCLALNSGGAALFLALRLAGVGPGIPVLTNSYTLAPVPGAICHAGGRPVLVGCSPTSFQLELASLKEAQQSSGARHLLLCYMRGKLPADLDLLLSWCKEEGITLIEDCAHVMGTLWRGRHVGTLGTFGCFSTQTNKLINSGEGGFLVGSDSDLMARAVIHSGSYGHFTQHTARPADDGLLLAHHQLCPNFSLRMTNLAAVLVLDQLETVEDKIATFNRHYNILQTRLGMSDWFVFPGREERERMVGTSFQFRLAKAAGAQCAQYQLACKGRGVKLAWFGKGEVEGFTSNHSHWRYAECGAAAREMTQELLHNLFDLSLYHTCHWDDQDFVTIADILQEEADKILGQQDQ